MTLAYLLLAQGAPAAGSGGGPATTPKLGLGVGLRLALHVAPEPPAEDGR